jgi:hypothetical protein
VKEVAGDNRTAEGSMRKKEKKVEEFLREKAEGRGGKQ